MGETAGEQRRLKRHHRSSFLEFHRLFRALHRTRTSPSDAIGLPWQPREPGLGPGLFQAADPPIGMPGGRPETQAKGGMGKRAGKGRVQSFLREDELPVAGSAPGVDAPFLFAKVHSCRRTGSTPRAEGPLPPRFPSRGQASGRVEQGGEEDEERWEELPHSRKPRTLLGGAETRRGLPLGGEGGQTPGKELAHRPRPSPHRGDGERAGGTVGLAGFPGIPQSSAASGVHAAPFLAGIPSPPG